MDDLRTLFATAESAAVEVHAAIAQVRAKMLRYETELGTLRAAVERLDARATLEAYEQSTLTAGLRLVDGPHSTHHALHLEPVS